LLVVFAPIHPPSYRLGGSERNIFARRSWVLRFCRPAEDGDGDGCSRSRLPSSNDAAVDVDCSVSSSGVVVSVISFGLPGFLLTAGKMFCMPSLTASANVFSRLKFGAMVVQSAFLTESEDFVFVSAFSSRSIRYSFLAWKTRRMTHLELCMNLLPLNTKTVTIRRWSGVSFPVAPIRFATLVMWLYRTEHCWDRSCLVVI
jgi:hypothetical protein